MKYEDYAKFERARLEQAQRKGIETGDELRRTELMKQLAEVLGEIEGSLSRELAAELRSKLGRLA